MIVTKYILDLSYRRGTCSGYYCLLGTEDIDALFSLRYDFYDMGKESPRWCCIFAPVTSPTRDQYLSTIKDFFKELGFEEEHDSNIEYISCLKDCKKRLSREQFKESIQGIVEEINNRLKEYIDYE